MASSAIPRGEGRRLAAGKGVVIAEDRPAADAAIRTVMIDRRFGVSGERVVLEEFLAGQEASYFVLADGTAFMSLSSAQDYKRIFDDDRGPNTGGMGAFAPSPLVTADVERRVLAEIVRPVLDGMQREGKPYRGFLYVGLMLTSDGPKVIEFNVRFGDPEAQVVPMRKSCLAARYCGDRRAPSRAARFRNEPHVSVVLATGSYPDAAETGKRLTSLTRQTVSTRWYFMQELAAEWTDMTAGGRVLAVVGR